MVHLSLFGAPRLEGAVPGQPGRVTQPRPLALLGLLAASGPNGMTRDRVIALLWSESDEAHARHHLSDALYLVRRELGPDAVNASGATLTLNGAVVSTDLAAFSRAVQSRQHAAAIAEYGGPFLDGFHLPGATAFEDWLTAMRRHLARQYADCLEAMANDAERGDDLVGAASWWRRLLQEDPLNSRAAMALARTLLKHGDRGNALEVLEAHRDLLRKELDADTGYDVRGLIDEARNGREPARPAAGGSRPEHGNGAATSRADVREAAAAPRRRRITWGRIAAFAVPAGAGAGLALFVMTGEPAMTVDPRLLAVPPFHAMTTSPSIEALALDVPDLFWATITGEFGLRVSDPTALEERWRRKGGEPGDALAIDDALDLARWAGAGLVVLGSVAGTETRVRLTASVLEVPGGRIRVAPTDVEGEYGQFPALVDRLVALLLAQDCGVPEHRLAALARHDPAAVQAYLSGLRARRDVTPESDWFSRALEMDSTLLLAALARYEVGESDQSMARLVWARRAQLHPRDAAIVVPLVGWRFGASRSQAERIAQYDRLVQESPAWAAPLSERAVLLFLFGRSVGMARWQSAAREASERLVAQDPGDLPAWFRLFSLALFAGDTAAALRYATAYGEQESRAGGQNGLGWLYSWTMRLRLALLVGDPVEAASLWAHADDVIRVAAQHPRQTLPIYASEIAPLVGGLLVDGRGLVALDSFMRQFRAVDSTPSFPMLNWARVRGHAHEYQEARSAVYDAMPPVTAAGLRLRDALFLGEPEGDAERAAATFLDRVARGVLVPPPDSTDPTPTHTGIARARCWRTLWNVAHGDVHGARQTIQQLRDTPLPYRYVVCAAIIDALVTRHEGGDARAAVLRLDSVVRDVPMESWPYGRGVRDLTLGVDNLIVARLLAEQGDTTRAVAAIRRGPWGPVATERSPQWALGMVPEYLWEGSRFAAALGDTGLAVVGFRQLLALRDGVSRFRAEQAEAERALTVLVRHPPPQASKADTR